MNIYICSKILTVFFLILSACGGYLESDRELPTTNGEVSYLSQVIPPCSMLLKPNVDPCPPANPPQMHTVSFKSFGPLWPLDEVPPSFDKILLQTGETHNPHIVIRGTVQPDSTRCKLYTIIVPNYLSDDSKDLDYTLNSTYHYYCFVDVNVQEYIVGIGPPVLTVALHREVMWIIEEDNPDIFDQDGNILPSSEKIVEEYSDYAASRTAVAYEGKEMILFLANTLSIAVESWETLEENLYIWFLQKTDEGIRVVAQDIIFALTDEQHAKLDLPLNDMILEIKRAHQNKLLQTGGRIGIDPALPMMVTDANFLQNFYKSIGAVYNTGTRDTVLPPPVSGDDDPYHTTD